MRFVESKIDRRDGRGIALELELNPDVARPLTAARFARRQPYRQIPGRVWKARQAANPTRPLQDRAGTPQRSIDMASSPDDRAGKT